MAALSTCWAVSLLAIASCRNDENAVGRDRRNSTPLDQAAVEAGIIADSESIDPVGIYERRHENGRHQLCIGADHRFGMVADLGKDLLCQGQGRVRLDGDRLRFVFDGGRACAISAGYDGRDVRFDGKIEGDCSALCSPRATFAGLAVSRIPNGDGDGDGATVRARIDRGSLKQGERLCG